MFLLFVVVGFVAGIVHNLLPGKHHLQVSACFVGLAGSWFGGFCAAAFVQGTFVTMGWVTLLGSVLGAVFHIALFELIARRFCRSYEELSWSGEGEQQAAGRAHP